MKRLLKGLGIFLALVGVGIVSALAVVALLLRQEEVRVPDLTGRDIVSVIEVLNQQGLQLKIDRREPSPTLPRDTIISQTPAPGNGIKKGRAVHLVVSLGPSELQTPKLVGEHFRRADVMIRQAAFFPGTTSRVSSETVRRDIVIAQDPQPGSPIDRGGKINVLVSAGIKADQLITPRLIGKNAEEAGLIADRMGLQCRVSYKPSGDGPEMGRTVIQQKPNPGSPIASGAAIAIVVGR